MYTLSIIRNLFDILDQRTKLKLFALQMFYLFSAVVQVTGVASIAPFVGLLSNPGMIHENEALKYAYNMYAFQSESSFIIACALISMALIIFANLVSGITLWLSLKFSISMGSNLQTTLFENLINRPYIFHKITDHSNVIALVNQEAPRLVYMVLLPFLLLTSNIFIAFIILVGLLVISPATAISAAIVVGGSYLITYIAVRKSLIISGKHITTRNTGVQATLTEAFIGVKELKLKHSENLYVEKFEQLNRKGLLANTYVALAQDIPKLVIESICFGAILLFGVFMLSNQTHTSSVVSMLSLYAIAGYKLLPAMQQIYRSISSMSANGSVVGKLVSTLQQETEPFQEFSNEIIAIDRIELSKVEFQYPNCHDNVLNELSISFEKGKINTVAGASGSGKSTLADIILGLLHPKHGQVIINNQAISPKHIRKYQRSIGYVPQQIFIINDTVSANIAFGEKHFDANRGKRALKLANAYDFVLAMPQGINTVLGENGKLLSGGQRQRIGIARAIYRNVSMLVLDEPTSALDLESEHDFMKILNSLKEDILIIIISHRPAAIKLSDNINIVAKGKVEISGSYDFLVNNNEEFKRLIAISEGAD